MTSSSSASGAPLPVVATRPRPVRVVVALVWTLALALVLHTLDRVILGEREGSGWLVARSPDAIPAQVGPIAVPAYLPDVVRWPPHQVHYRTGLAPGWWLGLGGEGQPVALWIGTGGDPLPPALGDASGCAIAPSRCPEGWRVLSAPLGQGGTLFVITRLDAGVATQILKDLH